MSSFLFSFLLVYIKLSSFLRTVWGPKTSLLTNTQADPHVSSAEKIYKAYNFLIALPIFLVVWGNTCDLQPTVRNKHLWCTAHSNTEEALYTFPVCCREAPQEEAFSALPTVCSLSLREGMWWHSVISAERSDTVRLSVAHRNRMVSHITGGSEASGCSCCSESPRQRLCPSLGLFLLVTRWLLQLPPQ